MDAIGIITQPVITAAPSVSGAPPVVQLPAAVAGGADQVDLSAQAAAQTVQSKTQDIANPHVLGDGTFTMFTVGGRLYTRFTTVSNGVINVTYVPGQPGITLGNSSGGGGASLLDIQA